MGLVDHRSSRSIRADSSLREKNHKRNLTVGFNSAMEQIAPTNTKMIQPNTLGVNFNTLSAIQDDSLY